MFDVVIKLIDILPFEVDENGFEVNKEESIEVFARVMSVKGVEFYQSQQIGVTLTYTFEMWAFEYNGEEYIEYQEQRYKIERVYTKNNEKVELMCSKVKKNG